MGKDVKVMMVTVALLTLSCAQICKPPLCLSPWLIVGQILSALSLLALHIVGAQYCMLCEERRRSCVSTAPFILVTRFDINISLSEKMARGCPSLSLTPARCPWAKYPPNLETAKGERNPHNKNRQEQNQLLLRMHQLNGSPTPTLPLQTAGRAGRDLNPENTNDCGLSYGSMRNQTPESPRGCAPLCQVP